MRATQNSMRSARRLRRSMSPPEVLLWQILRRSPAGIKFRRQYAIGPYVADFYCPSARLAIEIDGSIHNFEQQAEHDVRRDELIGKFGVRVSRIAASDVLRDAASVASAIVDLCSAGPLHHPRSRGENATQLYAPMMPSGPSPLARGELVSQVLLIHRLRTIPAGAGEPWIPKPPWVLARTIPAGAGRTQTLLTTWALMRDHPRWRGENQAAA